MGEYIYLLREVLIPISSLFTQFPTTPLHIDNHFHLLSIFSLLLYTHYFFFFLIKMVE